jgi:mono/diheme cytochrome c family protein
MRTIVRLIVAFAVMAGLWAYWTWRSAIAPIERPQASAFTPQVVQAGASLAAVGNCITCHTRDGGAAYAGGRPIETPFGRIHGTNITPDPDTGIGRWSEAAFVRAMREGVARDGRHLYPAFPYDHMAKTTDADIRSVYAFLMTRTAVRSQTPANALGFPYSMRSLVAVWKSLYHDRSPFKPNPAQTDQWNRGAYLVEGLAHCGSCHTPRTWLGAENAARAYAGGEVQGWTAPALGATSDAAVPWTAERLASYLRKGRSPQHGAAAGPMADVIGNLASVPDSDIEAISSYVAAIAGVPSPTRQAEASKALARAEGRAQVSRNAPTGPGAATYAGACAQCHGEAGRTPLDPALNLALSTSVRAASPNNLVRIILFGIRQPDNAPGAHMPGFASVLDDKQTAELVSFVRASFSDRPAFAGIDSAIRRAR